MKAGFINAFVRKPAKKYYSYHGIKKSCLTDPDPDPFEEFPLDVPPATWEIIYDETPVSAGYWALYYSIGDFFPSNEIDNCPDRFPDNKVRHYYYQVEYYKRSNIIPWTLQISDQIRCGLRVFNSFGFPTRSAGPKNIWGGRTWLIVLGAPYPGTFVRIWRSSNGLLPDYYPVPPFNK